MKKLLVSAIVLLGITGPAAQGDPKTTSLAWLDSNVPLLNRVNRNIWSWAETGLEEVKSSKELQDVLRANGFAVEAGVATGIVFAPATTEALIEAFRRATVLYGRDKVWRKMQRRGMKSDVSWEASAEKYADLYSDLLGLKRDDQADD